MGVRERYLERKRQDEENKTNGTQQGVGVAERFAIRKDSVNYGELIATNQSAVDTINRYQETMKNNGYMSAEDLAAYKSAVDTYTDTGNRMRSVAKYLGINYNDEDENAWQSSLSTLGSNYDSAFQYYSKFKTEDAWNQMVESVKATEEMLGANTAELAVEIAELKDYVDALETEWANARKTAAANTDPTESGNGEWADYEAEISSKKKEIAEKEAYLEEANRLQALARMESVANPDSEYYDPEFVDKSAYIPQEKTERSWLDTGTDNYATDPWEDPLYEAINGNTEALSYIGNKVAAQSSSGPEGGPLGAILGRLMYGETELLEMYPDEKKVYNYYANEGDADKAYEYYQLLESDLNARQRLKDMEENQKRAQEDPIGASLATVFMAPFKGISYAGQIADYLGDGKIDENAAYNAFSYTSSDIRGEVSRMIEGDGSTWGKIGSWGYQLGMGLGDFVASTVAGGGNETAVLMIMGTGAAADTTIAAKQRGLNDDQAFALGTIAGAAEVLSEKIGFDALMDVALLGKSKLVYVLKNVFSEGLEEPTSNLINTLADVIIAGDKSEWAMEIAAGKTTWEVIVGKAAELGLDALGGMISGAFMGGGTAAIQTVAEQHSYTKSGQRIISANGVTGLLELAADYTTDDTKLAKIASQVSDKSSGKNARQVGRLYSAVSEAVSKQNRLDLANGLIQKGVGTEAAQKIADIVIDAQTNPSGVTKAQAELLASFAQDQTISTVVNEVLNGENSAVYQRNAKLREITAPAAQTDTSSTASGPPSPQEEGLGRVTAADGETVMESQVHNQQNLEEKTFLQSSGEEVQSVSYKSIDNGSVTVTVNGSTEAAAGDVSFSNEADAVLFESIPAINHITAEGANVIWNAWKSGAHSNAGAFGGAAAQVFKAGYLGDATILNAGDSRAAALTSAQKYAIYQQGRKAAAADYDSKQAKRYADNKKPAKEKKGGVYYGYDGKTIDQRNDRKHKPLTKAQRVGVEFVKRLSKKFGSTVYFYESYVDENGNRVYKDRNGNVVAAEKGFYDPKDGSIHIDLNSGKVLYTIAHELVHFIRDWSPKHFKQMADIVMAGYSRENVPLDKLIADQQALAKEHGRELTEDEAFEEVIANALEGVMADGKVAEFLRAIEGKDKSLGAKVRQFFQDIAKLIQDTLDAYAGVKPDSVEGKMTMQLEDVYRQLQQVFAEGVHQSGENFRRAEKNTTGEGGVRHSLVVKRTNGTSTLEDPSKISRQKTLDYLLQSRKGQLDNNSYFPVKQSTPQIIISSLRNADIDITDRPLAMQVSKARQSQIEGKPIRKDGVTIRFHAMSAEKILEVIDNLDQATAIIHQRERKKTIVVDGERIAIDAPDNFAIFVTLQDGKEYVAIIEFDSYIDEKYIVKDGHDDKYHTTVTVFEPDVIRDGEPFDYIEYLLLRGTNREIDVKKESTKTETAYSETDATVSEKELSDTRITQPKAVVKLNSTTDSDGNELSTEQQAYFADSKERDAEGNLRVMYRGDSEEVMVFDRKKSKPSNLYGRGFYFTSENSHAGQYGSTRAFYLNAVNPLSPDQHNVTKEQMYNFLKAIEEDGEDYDLYNYGEDATAESVLKSVWGKGDFEMLQDVSASAVGDLVAAAEFFNRINGTSYDSIRTPTETVIFSSEQAKLTSNKNPTSNPDIRFSVQQKENATVADMLKKENEKLKADVEKLKELLKLQRTITGGTKFTESSVEAAARVLKKNAGATGNTAELASLLNSFYEYIATGRELTWEDVREQAKTVTRWLQDHVKHRRSEYAQEVLDQIHGSRIYLDESQKKEAAYRFGSFNDFRKSVMGSITIANDANTSLDSWWQEMASMYPDVFDGDLTAPDMPGELADIIDRLRNEDTSLMEYAYNMDMIEQDLIRQVYDSYWNISTLRTFADVKQAQINRLKYDHIQRMNKLKDENRQKTEQLKAQHRAEVEMIRSAYRQKLETQQKELSAKYQESRKKAVSKVRETAEKQAARKKLQTLVINTAKWIAHPAKTDIKCPDLLKKPYSDFLNSIDMSSERLAKGGDPTKNDLRLTNAMNGLATALEKIVAGQDPDQETAEVFDSGYLDLPADFVKQLRDMATEITEMMVEGDYVVNSMTAAEVRQLSQMIRTLNHAVKTMSTLYANLRFSSIEALGIDTMEFLNALGEIEKSGGIKDFALWENGMPYYVFKRFGAGGESVFEGLMDGQDKLAFHAKRLFAFQEKTWTAKEAKEWSEDVHTIVLPSGNKLTLTTADAMSIYCLSRREQGLQHLLGGGTRVKGLQKGSQKAKDSRSRLTIEDVNAINASLTVRQKEVANAIQRFMSTVCAEWGNEISMKRFLTKDFTEEFYFPIESNDENMTMRDPAKQQSDLFRLLNISATKPITPKANNEVIIRNIFDVFTGHASDMARLNAFGMPLLDYMKWLNYRQKSVNDAGQVNVVGVRKSMQSAYGDAAGKYVLNLIKDVNGRASDGGLPGFYKKMLQNAKTAMVGNNLRVATLQITSYPRAGLVLSQKSLALGLSKMPNIRRAQRYCGIALWKSFGFYNTDIARSMEDQIKGTANIRQKLIELSLKGAELGDAITWGALWNACEYEVAGEKKIEVGTEEFYQAVAKKLREVVYRTQVVDSMLTRSEAMRSKNAKMKELTSFMSEPTVSANILMDAGFTFSMEKRRLGSAKAAWKKAGGYIARAFAVYAEGQLAAALVEALWDTIRSDEDDEEKWEIYLKALGENLVLDLLPFNKIPIVAEFAEAAMSLLGLGYYSTDSIASTGLTQAISAFSAWAKFFNGKASDDPSVYKAIYKTMQALSSMTGIAGASGMRDLVALWNSIIRLIDEDLVIE